MEKRFQILNNGQQVIADDYGLLGETSGLADDRVFAELFRMRPFNGSSASKGVLPYGAVGTSSSTLIAPNGASGAVLVQPFRALVGSRTAVGSGAKANWRDIRSTISIGTTTLSTVVNIGANASGNPRWDLIYATVAVDAASASVTRKVKNPTTKVIAGTSTIVSLETTVSLSVAPGTAAASPTWPAAPSDFGSSYVIPLAYVRVPNGFNATSTVLPTDIAPVAPVLTIARSTGGCSMSVADQQYTAAGSALTTARIQTWGSTGTRPSFFMPSTMSGGESLLVAIDLYDPSSSNWSHAHQAVVDSRDWRNRVSRYFVSATPSLVGGGSPPEAKFAWDRNASPPYPGTTASGMGQSMRAAVSLSGDGLNLQPAVAVADGTVFGALDDDVKVWLYCDLADGGKLKVWIQPSADTPDCTLFFWIDFSGPYENAV